MKSAILGTIEIVALAASIAIPFGIGVALYLVEFGKTGRFANVVRYFVDVMTGVPSVVFGLFVYIVLVVDEDRRDVRGLEGLDRARAADAARRHAIGRGRPEPRARTSCARSALALGAPRWKVVFGIVLPTALPGLVTGSMLAVARAAGETAPLLFTSSRPRHDRSTSSSADELAADPDLQRRRQAQRPHRRSARGASALTLVVVILLLTTIARLAQRRSGSP